MKKNYLLPLMALMFLFLPTAFSRLYAQSSIIDQIQKSQPAIVTIVSEASGVYRSPEVNVAKNPKTGQVVAAHHLAKASYQRYGAGVVVHPAGIIVTNAHTVTKADHIQVILADNTRLPAKVINLIDNLDLALLKIDPPAPMPYVTIADSDKLELGQEVITVGNSQYLKQTISGGKIIGLGTNRTQQTQGKKRTDLIQTTINIYQGDSGGPLFDKEGNLIGLMTAKESRSIRSSFAIPSNKIIKYLATYLNELPQ